MSTEQEATDWRELRFTQIELANWRNFSAATTPLQRRMFFVGPNAAGKSNFLDAFRFLADIVNVGGGFESAVKRRGGVSMLRAFSARRYPGISIRVRLGTDAEESVWEYELTFSQDNQRRPVILKERVLHYGHVVLDRPDGEDASDPERLRQTHLEQVNVNRDFRDVAEFCASTRYMHIVPQLVREPDRSVGKANDPFGGDFIEQIARTTKRTRDARLRRIVAALRVAVPQLEELELTTDVRGVPHLRGKYKHWRKNGAWQEEAHYSDGTLRLMGLLWAVAEGRGPLLLEEPELSLHPEVVRYIPQMFSQVQRRSGRQILASTHSVELLADPGIALDEVVVLTPSNEGTSVALARDVEDICLQHAAGIPLPEILTALTGPRGVDQLGLFGARS